MTRAIVVARAYPQMAVETGEAFGDALVSITGIDKPPALVDASLFGGRILRLSFDDIPNGAWTDKLGNSWRGPTSAQLSEAISFARSTAEEVEGPICRIAVHCAQGKSRSAAVALALMADSLGPGQEAEAVRRLLYHDSEQRICCNPGIVRMADEMLGRNGAIESALEAGCPPFVTWRAYWVRHGCIDGRAPS